jgi:hypothetical protein
VQPTRLGLGSLVSWIWGGEAQFLVCFCFVWFLMQAALQSFESGKSGRKIISAKKYAA